MTGLSADLKLLAQSKDAFALDRSDYEFNSLSHHILHFPGHEASPFQKDLLPQSVRDALSQTVRDALSFYTLALGFRRETGHQPRRGARPMASFAPSGAGLLDLTFTQRSRDCCPTRGVRKTKSPSSRRRGGRDLKKMPRSIL